MYWNSGTEPELGEGPLVLRGVRALPLPHEEIDHALEWVEAELRGDRGPQVRVGIDVVKHEPAIGGLEVLDAADIELARGHDALAPCHGLRGHLAVRVELDRRRLARQLARAGAFIGVARRRWAQVEAPVRDDAHRVEQLAAQELHAHDA